MNTISLWLESMGIPPLLGGLVAGAVLVWVVLRLGSGDKSATVLGAGSGLSPPAGRRNAADRPHGPTELATGHAIKLSNNNYDLTDLELAEIFRHMRNGEKITAIKLVRERSGMGLAEAKQFVEELDERGIGH